MKRKDLRKIILSMLLSEQSTIQAMEDDAASSGLDFGSVDQQIDAFILKFEKDSIENINTNINALAESLTNLSLSGLLTEQEEEEEEEEVEDVDADNADTEASEDEAKVTEPVSDEDLQDVPEISDVPVPPLNIDEFTRRVARLAMNYDNLIDVQGAVIERALQFLKENYDIQHANELIDLLNSQFDFDIGTSEESTGDGPYAVGAYAGGTGGGGGGGSI
tara:strand:+ start:1778 stop:2437 length:660 start_codon:yes stop_codon:yes gene_type:complete